MKRKIVPFFLALAALFVLTAYYLWRNDNAGILAFHENFQLFLFTSGHFTERILLPGGFADYAAEFATQFFVRPEAGAMITSLSLLAVAVCVLAATRREASVAALPLCFVPPFMICSAMGDENVMPAYLAAAIVTLAFTALRRSLWPVTVPLAYWLAGPFAIVMPAYFAARYAGRRQFWVSAAVIVWAAAFIMASRFMGPVTQYTNVQVAGGLFYYRIPQTFPAILFVVPAATLGVLLLIPYVSRVTAGKGARTVCIAAVAATVCMFWGGTAFAKAGGNNDSRVPLRYCDMLLRHDWQGIVNESGKSRPQDILSVQATNIALAMQGRLADDYFQYNVGGTECLFTPDFDYNCMSSLPTAEVFYRMGLANLALMMTYDSQEAIMNQKKSGKMMCRIAECYIIIGRYAVAEKFLDILKKSLYYSDWAEEASRYLYNDEAVAGHKEWGALRRKALHEVRLFNSMQAPETFKQLCTENPEGNGIAFDYYMLYNMLAGTLQPFIADFRLGDCLHRKSMPKAYQEAWAMIGSMAEEGDSIGGRIYPAGQAATDGLARFMQAYQRGDRATFESYHDTYWYYFLSRQQ